METLRLALFLLADAPHEARRAARAELAEELQARGLPVPTPHFRRASWRKGSYRNYRFSLGSTV